MPTIRTASLILAAVATASIIVTPPPASASAGFELWPSCDSFPDFSGVEFLPIFTPSETPGFVDLGTEREHAGKTHRELQFTRDKQFSLSVPVGTYLFGLLGDEWPPDTVDAVLELHAGRLVRLEVDGEEVSVQPDCIRDLNPPEGNVAIYNVLIRFLTAGDHVLRYVWEQKRAFYFVLPVLNDPFGLDGRRVFVGGEVAGTELDGELVLEYHLTVVP